MSVCQLLVASVVLLVAAPILSGGLPSPVAFSRPVVGAVVALGAIGTGVAFVTNMRNIRLVGASTASMVTYVVPVFATLLGVMVLQERLDVVPAGRRAGRPARGGRFAGPAVPATVQSARAVIVVGKISAAVFRKSGDGRA